MKTICQMGTESISFHVEMYTTPGSCCRRVSSGVPAGHGGTNDVDYSHLSKPVSAQGSGCYSMVLL